MLCHSPVREKKTVIAEAVSPIERVIPRAAGQRIGPCLALQVVVARPAVELVVAEARVKHVVLEPTAQPVVARAAADGVGKFDAGPAGQRLDPQQHLAELAGAAALLLVAVVALGGCRDGLAVGDARRLGQHLALVELAQPLQQQPQVQLTQAVDQRLLAVHAVLPGLLDAIRTLSYRVCAIGLEPRLTNFHTEMETYESPFMVQNFEVNAYLDAYQRQLDQAEKRFEVGLIAITDVQQARAARDTLRQDPSHDLVLLDLQLGDADGFDLLADLVCNPLFPPGEIDKEKEVVLEEIASVNDTPEELVFEDFDRRTFPGHSQLMKGVLRVTAP